MVKAEINENARLVLAMIGEGRKGDITAFADALRAIKEIEADGMTVVRDYKERIISRQYDEENFRIAHEYSALMREYMEQVEPEDESDGQKLMRIYRDTLLFDAPFDFDCFCRFIEWDREPAKVF